MSGPFVVALPVSGQAVEDAAVDVLNEIAVPDLREQVAEGLGEEGTPLDYVLVAIPRGSGQAVSYQIAKKLTEDWPL